MENKQTTNETTRFTVLRHTACLGKEDHYDIVIEKSFGTDTEEVALAKYESLNISSTIEAAYEREVRRRYLTYEGSMGENRGYVSRVDSGNCRKLGNGNFLLEGKILSLELKELKGGNN